MIRGPLTVGRAPDSQRGLVFRRITDDVWLWLCSEATSFLPPPSSYEDVTVEKAF